MELNKLLNEFVFIKELESALENLPEASKAEDWQQSYTIHKCDQDHVMEYADQLYKTRVNHGLTGDTAMHWVSTGERAAIALTGNTPGGEARARYIALLSPKNVRMLLAMLNFYMERGETQCSTNSDDSSQTKAVTK